MGSIGNKTQVATNKYLQLLSKQKTFVTVVVLTIVAVAALFYFKSINISANKITLVQGFPVLPVYPRAELVTSTSDPHEGEMYFGVRYGATWNSKASVPELSKWYIEKLKSSGWNLESLPANTMANDVQLVTFSNDIYSLNMSFAKDPGSNISTITAEFSRKYSLGEPKPNMK